MAHMVRKQIYLQKRHQAILKRLARLRGASEAEIIRQAIEREVLVGASTSLAGDHSALQNFLKFARSRTATASNASDRGWKRDELYEERLARYDRASK